MVWIYGRNLMSSTGRRTLVGAVFVLAAMVLLLWFGSLRGPGVALAAEFDTNGDQSIDERCFLAIPCWLHDGSVIGDQTLWEEQDENVGALEAQGTETFATNGDQSIDERCFLAIPCWLHDGTVIGDQTMWEEQDENVGALEAQGTETEDSFEIQLLGTSLNSGGEDNVGRCLLPGIPCIHEPGSGLTGQSAGVLSTSELHTY